MFASVFGPASRASLVAGALLFIALAGVAYAHADFIRSDPPANSVLEAAPERVQIWFTEPLEPGFSEVQVLDASRQRVDLDDGRVLPDDLASMVVGLPELEDGTYTVAWRVLSTVDGHVTSGAFSLSIGVGPAEAPATEPAGAPGHLPFEATARWLGYLGIAALLGGALFHLLVLYPAARYLGLDRAVLPAAGDALRPLAWLAWTALLVATILMLLLQVLLISGSDSPSVLRAAAADLLLTTRYGAVSLVRFALLGAVLAVLLLAPSHRRGPAVAVAGLGSLVLLTTSLTSHSASVRELTWLSVGADFLHQFGAAAWVGGLLSLVLVLPAALKPLNAEQRGKLQASAVARFSALALVSVGALGATGLYLWWVHVGSLGALLETLYGQTLLAKSAIVAPVLVLGAANFLVIRPGLAMAVGRAATEQVPRLATYFRWLVLGEVVLVALVLLASGVLTSLSPARLEYERLEASRPLEMSAATQDVEMTLNVAPARPGWNTFTLHLKDAEGRPIEDAERVDLRFTYLEEELGRVVETAEPQGDGRYMVAGALVSLEGSWRVEVLVRQAGRDDVREQFHFRVTPTSAEEVPSEAAVEPAAPDEPGAWAEVIRWSDRIFMTSEPFEVSGPWRIRWRLENSEEAFLYMLGEVTDEGDQWSPVLAGDLGATSGVIEQQDPGTYRLMFHNSVPYEVVVEERVEP